MTEYRFLCPTFTAEPAHKRRWWVECGQAFAVTESLQVEVLRQRRYGSARYQLRLDVVFPGHHSSHVLAPGEALDLRAWTGTLLRPVALRLAAGRPQAVLIEVVCVHALAAPTFWNDPPAPPAWPDPMY